MRSVRSRQVVVVKKHEVDDYKAMWPTHVIFELPCEASRMGLSASRHMITELAKLMVPGAPATDHSPRFAFVMDDSVQCWKVMSDDSIPVLSTR